MTLPGARADVLKLAPAPSPADNPLKGLVPYSNMAGETFPHSMEFGYVPLSELMTGADSFDWQAMETLVQQGKVLYVGVSKLPERMSPATERI